MTEEKKVKRKYLYENTTKRNAFTSAGRVMAGEKVSLYTDEGNATKGLEKCAQK